MAAGQQLVVVPSRSTDATLVFVQTKCERRQAEKHEQAQEVKHFSPDQCRFVSVAFLLLSSTPEIESVLS